LGVNLDKVSRPHFKKKRKTRAGGMAQVVKFFPILASKYKALNPNPSTTKKKKV
jgi:hypothetical protein